MKTLAQLSATLTDTPAPAGLDLRANVIEEPRPGFFRATSLGHAGLQLRVGEERVLIPLSELWALVEAHCPAFRPPAPARPQSSTAVPAASPE